MNFFIRFLQRRKQSARMQALKEQQRLSRAESRNTKFTTAPPQTFRQSATKPKTEKNKTTALRRFLNKDGWAALGIFCIIFSGVYVVVFRSNQFVLVHTEIHDTQFVPKQEIESAVQGILSRSILSIPRNNYWTISANTIEKSLEKTFEKNFAVADIIVKKHYPNRIEIIITERIPSVTWVTTDEASTEHFYTIDHSGLVTKETLKREDVDTKLPQIEDKNRPLLGINWQISSTSYIDSIMTLQKKLTETGWSVQSFVFPAMTCEEQEYIAQQIFADEIKDSISEKFKEKKRTVQEQFKKGELGLEESLEALEEIKKEELAERDGVLSPDGSVGATPKKLEWATVDKEVACDYVQVASDLHVIAKKDSDNLIELKFDTTRELDEQLQQLQVVVGQGKVPLDSTKSIDLRIKDRVYYK